MMTSNPAHECNENALKDLVPPASATYIRYPKNESTNGLLMHKRQYLCGY